MNDDTTPAWASALLQVMNDRFDQADAQLGTIAEQMNRIADKMAKNADELEQANATLDRILARMMGRG